MERMLMRRITLVLVLVGYREDSVAVKASPLSFRIRPKLTRPRKFDQPSAQINNRPKWSRRKLGIRKERQKNVAEPVPSTIADMNEHCKGESLIRGRTGFFYGIGEDLLQRGNEVLCKDKNDPNIRDSTEDGDLNAAGDVKINEYSSTADHIAAGLSKTDRVEHDKDVPRIFDRSTILREDREIAGFRDVMSEVVDEFQKTASDLRENIILLREEMAELNKNYRHRKSNDELDENRLGADDGLAFENLEEERYRNKRSCRSKGLVTIQQRRKRQVEFDELADTVEEWANNLVREGGSAEHGWKEVECMKLFRSKYNANGTTKCYIKWMSDQRGDNFTRMEDDGKLFPCLKCHAVIDATLDQVCDFLSDELHVKDYNDLVVSFRDLEDISPNSKICWGQSPQLFFVKPRDFVTFCSHRWKNDGTQVVVNQAVEHSDAPSDTVDGANGICRARALRGANFIERDPNDTRKTKITLICHGDPGGDLPQWACRRVIATAAPIEPFKLFHNIENAAKRMKFRPRAKLISVRSGRSSRPGGLSQFGYACFWPNGGGREEVFSQTGSAITVDPHTYASPPCKVYKETLQHVDGTAEDSPPDISRRFQCVAPLSAVGP